MSRKPIPAHTLEWEEYIRLYKEDSDGPRVRYYARSMKDQSNRAAAFRQLQITDEP